MNYVHYSKRLRATVYTYCTVQLTHKRHARPGTPRKWTTASPGPPHQSLGSSRWWSSWVMMVRLLGWCLCVVVLWWCWVVLSQCHHHQLWCQWVMMRWWWCFEVPLCRPWHLARRWTEVPPHLSWESPHSAVSVEGREENSATVIRISKYIRIHFSTCIALVGHFLIYKLKDYTNISKLRPWRLYIEQGRSRCETAKTKGTIGEERLGKKSAREYTAEWPIRNTDEGSKQTL